VVPRNACSWQLKKADVRAQAAECGFHKRTPTEGVLLDRRALHSSMHSKWHTLLAEQGFGDRQRVFVLYGFKRGFPGILVSAELRKMCSVAQILRRVLCYIFCCALVGGFWSHAFLKSTRINFGGGLVQVVLELPCGHW
jgi:hypothetical protein